MKRHYKRILACLLAVSAILISGCGSLNQKTETKAKESTPSEAGTLTIGVSIYRYDDTFMKLYRSELKQYLEETYHAEVVMRNAGGDQNEQNNQVRQFIEDGCDGIIVNPVDIQAAGAMADNCKAAGIPLVFINREPKEQERKRWEAAHMQVSSVGTDSRQAGTYQGEIILETPDQGDINGDGVVSYIMIKGEEGNDDSQYRSEYSVKALKDNGLKTEELFSGNGNWDQEEGKKLVQEALNVYGSRIEVIFCNNDAMASGALEAVTAAGRIPGKDIYLVGVDALQETIQSIKEGKITGTVFNDHEGQSHVAADTLLKMIDGEEVETRYLVDYIKVTEISTFNNEKGDD